MRQPPRGFGGVAIGYWLDARHQAVGMGLDLVDSDGHDTGECVEAARVAGFGRKQEPALGSEQYLGICAVRMQAQPSPMPQASCTRPSSTASGGRAAGSRPGSLAISGGGGSGLGGLLDQTCDDVGGLGADAGPVVQAVLGDAQGFFAAAGQRVVKPMRSMKRPSRRFCRQQRRCCRTGGLWSRRGRIGSRLMVCPSGGWRDMRRVFRNA